MELKRIKIEPGALALCVILILYSEAAVPFLAAAVAHELGHLLAAASFSARIEQVKIGLVGAVIRYDNSRLSYGQELVCISAGPAFNLLSAAASAAYGSIFGSEAAYAFAGANIALFLFNMLPVSILDGGRIINISVRALKGPTAADNLSFYADMAVSSVLFIFSAVMTVAGRLNATLMCLSAVMLILCCKKAEIGVKS